MKSLNDVVFLGQQDFGFKEHDERRVSSNRGNFQKLVS